MLNLSIMPLLKTHIDEYCEDIIAQQKDGVSTHAMFIMTFNPEGTPPVNKAEEQCETYDIYRERLDKAGAKHGVLVQSTLGHITVPFEPYPFMPSVSLITGEERVVTCCPLDPHFHEYIKEQMKILAKRNPSIVMIDDDMGLLYKATKGCACKYHMAEFNKRAGTQMTREELYKHITGNSEEDKYYTDIYVETQKYGLVSAVKAMREGIDEVNPSIQGIVSGIYTSTFCEFSDDIAQAFAGKGNPAIIRLNGGQYAWESSKGFTSAIFRAAILKENVKDKVDRYLAETDTCPQNRYSTPASRLHAHFTASIQQGATGAKHWITRIVEFEPASGKAYRKILSKYQKFYEKMVEYTKELRPFGCRIPLTLMQNYGFVKSNQNSNLSPWSTCVLERLGLPMYFSNDDGGAVFIDDFSVDGFSDEQITKFLQGTLILSVGAADKLCKRGFSEHIGVTVSELDDKVISFEIINGKKVNKPYLPKRLTVCNDAVEVLSEVVHHNKQKNEYEYLFPGVTSLNNSLGGNVIVVNCNPDMPFKYFTAFSLLNETRKKQFVEILSKGNNLPIYYPEDCEVYLRAGYLNNGEIMATFYNLGLDILEDLPIVCANEVKKIEKLNSDGTRSQCSFIVEDGVIRVQEEFKPYIPVVLFVS